MSTSLEMLKIIEANCSIDENGISPWISLETLQKKYPQYNFLTSNGGSWRRNGTSPLGKKYIIKTKTIANSSQVGYIKLEGFNKLHEDHSIPKHVRDYYKNVPNEMGVITVTNELDHKNGRYNPADKYDIADFQVLSKAANDAKRQYCKKCKETGKRFDATCLGYPQGYIEGDENYRGSCVGCYQHDIRTFRNKIIKM